jgi:hypothetical protein
MRGWRAVRDRDRFDPPSSRANGFVRQPLGKDVSARLPSALRWDHSWDQTHRYAPCCSGSGRDCRPVVKPLTSGQPAIRALVGHRFTRERPLVRTQPRPSFFLRLCRVYREHHVGSLFRQASLVTGPASFAPADRRPRLRRFSSPGPPTKSRGRHGPRGQRRANCARPTPAHSRTSARGARARRRSDRAPSRWATTCRRPRGAAGVRLSDVLARAPDRDDFFVIRAGPLSLPRRVAPRPVSDARCPDGPRHG